MCRRTQMNFAEMEQFLLRVFVQHRKFEYKCFSEYNIKPSIKRFDFGARMGNERAISHHRLRYFTKSVCKNTDRVSVASFVLLVFSRCYLIFHVRLYSSQYCSSIAAVTNFSLPFFLSLISYSILLWLLLLTRLVCARSSTTVKQDIEICFIKKKKKTKNQSANQFQHNTLCILIMRSSLFGMCVSVFVCAIFAMFVLVFFVPLTSWY